MAYKNPMMKFFYIFRLPLLTGTKTPYIFLKNHFQRFDKELEVLLSSQKKDNIFNEKIYSELNNKKKIIKKLCQSILDTLKAHNKGRVSDAHRIFENKMNEVQDHIAYLNLKGYRLFRIRAGSKEKRFKRKDLFHIRFEDASLMRPYRYNLPGFPSLYLGASAYSDNGLPLCWFECDLPSEFYWSEFEITKQITTFPVIDFVYSPFSSLSMAHWYLNQSHNNSQNIRNALPNFIMAYPLMAACSLIKNNKNSGYFISEYIIPQMLLLWVRNSQKCNGIAYPSASKYKETRGNSPFNVAIPTKSIKEKGYCPKLKKEFRLSKPNFVDIAHEVFRPLDQRYIDCRNIIYECLQTLGIEPLRTMASVCDSFILLHSRVKSEGHIDLVLTYDYIKNLALAAEQLKKFQKIYILEGVKEIKKGRFGKDTKFIVLLYKDAWEKFIEFEELISSYTDFIYTRLQSSIPDFKYI